MGRGTVGKNSGGWKYNKLRGRKTTPEGRTKIRDGWNFQRIQEIFETLHHMAQVHHKDDPRQEDISRAFRLWERKETDADD